MMDDDGNTLIGDSSLYAQNDGGARMTGIDIPLSYGGSTLAGASGMADQVRHDGDEHTTVLLPARGSVVAASAASASSATQYHCSLALS
jgi:hypothetical protein